MTIDEQITIFEHNAEHERKEGDLNNCLHFRQLAELLKELKTHREAWENLHEEIIEYKNRGFFGVGVKDLEEGKQVALGWVLGAIETNRPKGGDIE